MPCRLKAVCSKPFIPDYSWHFLQELLSSYCCPSDILDIYQGVDITSPRYDTIAGGTRLYLRLLKILFVKLSQAHFHLVVEPSPLSSISKEILTRLYYAKESRRYVLNKNRGISCYSFCRYTSWVRY